MKRHDELMRLTKEQLTQRILELEAAPPTNGLAERDIRIHSPAGPVHVFRGFVDDGTGAIVIRGLPEDEIGHWHPYYSLTANEQDLGRAEIVARGEGDGGT